MNSRNFLCAMGAVLLSLVLQARGADEFLITEFMAANNGPLVDEDGETSDWIEIHNAGTNAANLNGWFLTDKALLPTQWSFPGTNLAPNAYLIVFASGKDRRGPGAPLHTNFKLSNSGEYLALVRPDGTNVVSAFAPQFPPQVSGVSYGIPVQQTVTTLIASGATARVLVPQNGALGSTWTAPLFDASGWLSVPTGVGYETDGQVPFVPAPLADSVAEFSGAQGQNNWFYGYWDRKNDADGIYSDGEFVAFPNDGGPFSANNFWTGASWDWFNGDPPFTQWTSAGGRPSGDNGSPVLANHWAVRRYLSETEGAISLTGQITHTSDWRYVTATGIAANSLIYVYLTGTGDGYIDDLKLVSGSVAESGPNLLPNGDFESGSLAPWILSTNLSGSTVTTAVYHSGTRSLHIVSTAVGASQSSAIWQTLSPALVNLQTYTLSYWYLPGPKSSPLVVRTSARWIDTTPTLCGDGTVARIFVDGVPVLEESAFISSTNYSLSVPVHLGSRVDFALDSGGAGDDACDQTTFTASIQTTETTVVVADSLADWSFRGTQGEKNWFYGYYNKTADTNSPPFNTYQASDFIPFPRGPGPFGPNNFWDGASWDWWNGDPPLDEIGQRVMQTTGLNHNEEHWVIRRWISTVSGTITVDWTLIKLGAEGAGVTARILRNGTQVDAATFPGITTAPASFRVVIPNVQVGDAIDIALDPAGLNGGFGDGGDRSFLSAIIRGHPTLTSQIASNIEAAMRNVNASAYLRIPFTVADPSAIQFLTLRMKYNDGFVAYLNGQRVASASAPDFPAWNSAATLSRPDLDAGEYQMFDLTSARGALRGGANVLAIQGLNASAADSDFLILPELLGSSVTFDPSAHRYFSAPTPGAVNGTGTPNLGPLILSAVHTPPVPNDNDDLFVTATVLPTFNPLSSVRLVYRVMYSNEVNVAMFDDGLHGDGAAGDGLFGGILPASASGPGQMVRYYVYATDTLTNSSRFPAFDDPQNSPQYQGTIVFNPTLTNPLPVLHMFVQNPTLATNDVGTRCSLFYDDEFYDNVFVNLHGQTTAAVFWKRGMTIDLTRGHRFRWNRQEMRVGGFNLLSPLAEKDYIRQIMAYETFGQAGVPSHFAFPVRLQQNGAFFGVFHFVEKGDDNFLQRVGLDPKGALYKVYLPLTSAYGGGAEKKTRQNEPNDDLQALIEGCNQRGQALRRYLYDNIDIPEVINFLATIQLVQNEDCCRSKNYYLYRDTEGTGQWQILPWDLDLTFGRTFRFFTVGGQTINGYFDTNIYWTNLYYTQIRSTYDFIGVNQPLVDALFLTPETYDMFLRRWSTVQEEFLQTNNTHPLLLKFERRVDELSAQVAPDAALDLAAWGTWTPVQTQPQAAALLKTEYFARRRGWIFNTLRFANDGPYLGPQPANLVIRFGDIEFNPSSGNQAQEYFQLTNANNYAVDLSGWKINGAVEFAFREGTVLPAFSAIYVSPDVRAFRARTSGPRGGQGLFVVGNYQGQLSARGESLQLCDSTGRLVRSTNYLGTPSLAQQYLRVTEIMYHPAPPPPGVATNADEFEFIEVKNTGPAPIPLDGVHFASGIEFDFTGSVVTSLAPAESAVVVRNIAAFESRYGPGLNIAGEYVGLLDNQGENLRIEDATGEKILDFNYDNHWYPITDGLGFSLVIVDENASWDTWGLKSSWRPSGNGGGSPGQTNPPSPVLPGILVNEVLTHTDLPSGDVVELYNPTASTVNLGGWFLSDDFNSPKKFRIPNGAFIVGGGYRLFDEQQFNPLAPPSPTGFAFSAKGDAVYLFSGDANTNLTGYFHGFAFGAASTNVTIGRYVTSVGEEHVVAQSAATLSGVNAGPLVGPVVISEIHYRPPDVAGGGDNSGDEFIELQNITGAAVSLFDSLAPSNTWHLRGVVDFDFPPGLILGASNLLVLVNFNPTDAAPLAAFRNQYAVPATVPVFGPYRGKLDNSSGSVKLSKPAAPDAGVVPFILVDEVDYADAAPWPKTADGAGASLQRLVASQYGNDPINWTAAAPTAGRSFSGGVAPAILMQPASLSAIASANATLSLGAVGTPTLRYQWRFNGANIIGATNSSLTLTNILGGNAGVYAAAVFNHAGSVESSNAMLTLLYGPYFIQQPQSIGVKPGFNGTFVAMAASPAPLRYQWRFSGADLPGATNFFLTINNARLDQNGVYQVIATDNIGSVPSAPATLTLLIEPIVTQQPLSQSLVPGGSITLSVSVTNTATLPIGYRVRRNGVTLPAAPPHFVLLNERTAYFTLSGTNTMPPWNNYAFVITNLAFPSGKLSSSAILTYVADIDGDGVPDNWVATYFGLATGWDRNADPDGDGMTNWQEYNAGTDPTNALSYLKVDAITAGAGATLLFGAISNRTYTIQYADELGSGQWFKLADVLARATNRTETVMDAVSSPTRYYRVVTPRQP